MAYSSKITDLDVPREIKQDISELEVFMSYSRVMHVPREDITHPFTNNPPINRGAYLTAPRISKPR